MTEVVEMVSSWTLGSSDELLVSELTDEDLSRRTFLGQVKDLSLNWSLES